MAATTLTFRGNAYPRRSGFFAHKFQRLLAKVCATNDIGCDGFALLVIVSQIEDSRRYSSAPGFFNCQLQAYLACSEKQLRRIRQKCIDAGWLHYEPGGRRRPGVYWVVIPECYGQLDDDPLGESAELYCPGGRSNGQSNGHPNGQDNGQSNGHPSLPKPKPSPTPKERVVVVELLKSAAVGRIEETIDAGLSNGLSLDQMAAICRYWSSRPHAWGPGALVKRLTSPSAPELAPDQGWPPPSPKEKQQQREAALREDLAKDRDFVQQNREGSHQRRSHLQQLELQFGEEVDRLPVETLVELLGEKTFLVRQLRRSHKDQPDGRKRDDIRPELLAAFAAQAANN